MGTSFPKYGSSSGTGGGSASSSHPSFPSGDGSSSSRALKEDDLIQNTTEAAHATDAVDGKDDVNLDALVKYISVLLDFHSGKSLHKNSASKPEYCTSAAFSQLQKCLEKGVKLSGDLADIISSEEVRTVLHGIGRLSIATSVLSVVACVLEKVETITQNKEECISLLVEMTKLARYVKQLKERPGLKEDMKNPIKNATELVVKSALMCCSQMKTNCLSKFFSSDRNKQKLKEFKATLSKTYRDMDSQIKICIYDAAKCRIRRSPLPRERAYPTHAVGIEVRLKEVTELLDLERKSTAVAVLLHGFGGIGKTTLADALFARFCIEDCKYSMVRLSDEMSSPDILGLQKCILEDLMREKGEQKPGPDIITFDEGQRKIGDLLKKNPAFIYIDNAFHRDVIEQIFPPDMTNVKWLRLLITGRDKDVLRGCRHLKKKVYPIKCLTDEEATELLKKEMLDRLDKQQLKNIVQICGGIPRLLVSVAGFIGSEEDQEKTYQIVIQDKERLRGQIFRDIEHYVFAYDSLPEMCKDPFLDICSFFKGWDWNTVEDIVGHSELDMLEKRALVHKDTDMTLSVNSVILAIGNKIGHGSRFKITNAEQMEELFQKDIQGIKGIWFNENKDPLDIPIKKLDSMSNSLRILSLGNSAKVTGKSTQRFEKLLFFQGEVPHLPFTISHLEELRYLDFQPEDLNLLKGMQSNVRYMELNGKGLSNALEISSIHFQQLQNLRVLKLVSFKDVKKLPDELGNLTNVLQELVLSDCSSIQELPKSISKLQNLKILNINDYNSVEMYRELLDKAQWKRLILNEKGCETLKLYLELLEVTPNKRLSLSVEDCESDKVYLESLDALQLKKMLFNQEGGCVEDCENDKVYLDSLDALQLKKMLFNQEGGCESVEVGVDSLEVIQWKTLISRISEYIE